MAGKEEARERHDGQEEAPEEEHGVMLPGWIGDAPWWAISAVLHTLILLLIGGIVMTTTSEAMQRETAIIQRSYKAPPYDPRKERDITNQTGVLRQTNQKLVKRLKPDKITPDIPKGTSRYNLSNKNLRHTGRVDPFGLGGDAAGAYGERLGHGSLISEGGTKATEEAVRAALGWLTRHQNPDGSWSCHAFTARCCKEKGPCRIHARNPDPAGGDGRGWKEHDIGVTALAVLAFTGYGHTHQLGIHQDYVEALRKALQYLKSVQITGTGDPNYDGAFRHRSTIPTDKSKEAEIDEDQQWMYGHAFATMAVAELLTLSGDMLDLKRCVEEAALFCLRAQNDNWGWRYSVKLGDNDTSVTGWMVLALKTVRACLLMEFVSSPTEEELERSFNGALRWFHHATSSATGVTGYRSPGDEGSRLPQLDELAGGYPFSKELSCMTAVSVLCRLFAGETRANESIKRGVINVLMRHPPKWRLRRGKSLSTINFYYWYYGTFAMFQYGGPMWLQWNESMKRALLESQRARGDAPEGGCEDGSWDPISEWGIAGGRVYTTAIGALTLQVYYRYVRAQEGRGF